VERGHRLCQKAARSLRAVVISFHRMIIPDLRGVAKADF
jgi:hypothetical protein